MMIYIPGAPVTITHLILSLYQWNKLTHPIIAPYEKLTAIIPVYNEEKNITKTLNALLGQTELPQCIIISDNGSYDDTPFAIDSFFRAKGYALRKIIRQYDSDFEAGQYEKNQAPTIIFMQYKHQISKAKCINKIQKYQLIKTSRTLLLDSDTILHPRFIEKMNENWYALQICRNKAIIRKSDILGGTVLPKRGYQAGIQGNIITRARETEYTVGQMCIKNGQNLTALQVVPGCGLMCQTDKLIFSGKTVTDDMELTQIVQSKKKVSRLTESVLRKFITDNFQLKLNGHLVPLVKFLEGYKKPVYFSENNATYVEGAFMYTQEPGKFKSLYIQLSRWTGGFHQILFLQRKKLRQGNKRVLFTLYGAKFEGLINSLIFFALPCLILIKLCTGYGVSIRYVLLFYILDASMQISEILLATYRKNRLLGNSKGISLKYSFLAISNLLFVYAIRCIHSLQFLNSYLKTMWEIKVQKKTAWNAQWQRPHGRRQEV